MKAIVFPALLALLFSATAARADDVPESELLDAEVVEQDSAELPGESWALDPAALCQPWHCDYKYTEWGMPVAILVPPNVEKHVSYGWGVGGMRVHRNQHQFRRFWPGKAYGKPHEFKSLPVWPSDTSQFGVYYIRGPW